MATASIKYVGEGFVCFTLSNKPQYECFLDEEDFQLVEHNSCWYIHHKPDEEIHAYIRRTQWIDGRYVTEGIADFILQISHIEPRPSVMHKNSIGTDNRKSNLYLKGQSNITP